MLACDGGVPTGGVSRRRAPRQLAIGIRNLLRPTDALFAEEQELIATCSLRLRRGAPLTRHDREFRGDYLQVNRSIGKALGR